MKLIGLVLKLTNRCNLQCEFCYRNKLPMSELDIEEIKLIIKGMVNLNASILRISGGEPLLRKDINDIVKIARTNNINTSISTNGILLTKDKIKSLQEVGLNELHFSIGDMTDLLKVNFIEEKINLVRKISSDIKISVNVITTKKFINAISENLDYIVNYLKIDFIDCIVPKRGENIEWYTRNKIDVNDFYILKDELDQLGIKYIFDCGYYEGVFSERFKKLSRKSECWILNDKFKFITIESDGKVYECPYANEKEFYIGNVRDNNIKDIFENYNLKNYEYESLNIPCIRNN